MLYSQRVSVCLRLDLPGQTGGKNIKAQSELLSKLLFSRGQSGWLAEGI